MEQLGERRNLWGNVILAFQSAMSGRSWGFVSMSYHSSEYLLDQNRSSRYQPHDLAPAAGPWKHLPGRPRVVKKLILSLERLFGALLYVASK